MSDFKSIEIKDEISYNDFQKIDIRVGEILSVIDIGESDNLVKLTVDFGEFKRLIVASIKNERENPQEIEGLQALFVVNLKPKEMFGVKSHGMLFDLGYENKINPVLAVPNKEVPNGTCAG
ncbi:MAG: tRNA-binding protein [Bacillota bacterium]